MRSIVPRVVAGLLALAAVILLFVGTNLGPDSDESDQAATVASATEPPPAAPSGPLVLVAGIPGGDVPNERLFGFDKGSWGSVAPTEIVNGHGYFASEQMQSALGLADSPAAIQLSPGWNLIGNSSNTPVALPEGITAFVLSADRSYSEVNQLDPGQGAWIKSEAETELMLAPASKS